MVRRPCSPPCSRPLLRERKREHCGSEQPWNETEVLGHSLVHSLIPLTHLLTPSCLLCSRARSFVCSLACSLTPELVGKWMIRCVKVRLFEPQWGGNGERKRAIARKWIFITDTTGVWRLHKKVKGTTSSFGASYHQICFPLSSLVVTSQLEPSKKHFLRTLFIFWLTLCSGAKTSEVPFCWFLDAFSHLYTRVSPSVRLFVGHTRVELMRNRISGLYLN